MPAGKNIVITHWYADPTDPGDPSKQKGVRQACVAVSGPVIKDFMAKYPYAELPGAERRLSVVSTFVFVHGAWHGAWCWSRLLPEMEARGHRSVVMDLPVDDGNATFEDYANAVLASYPAELEDAVLVGHSLGAMVMPLVATSRPASLLVFLCGVIPNVEGKPWDGAPPMGRPEAYQTETMDDGSSVFRTVESARRSFYADCDPRMPPGPSRTSARRIHAACGTVHTRLTRLPVTPRAAIAACRRRRHHHRIQPRRDQPRLGVDLIEIPGAHSPFLARPREVASLLDRLVRS